jgi:hypothetical protein
LSSSSSTSVLSGTGTFGGLDAQSGDYVVLTICCYACPPYPQTLYNYKDLKYVGFELWQVKAGSIFDNILVADSLEEAEKFANDTWAKTKDGEKEMFDKVGNQPNRFPPQAPQQMCMRRLQCKVSLWLLLVTLHQGKMLHQCQSVLLCHCFLSQLL